MPSAILAHLSPVSGPDQHASHSASSATVTLLGQVIVALGPRRSNQGASLDSPQQAEAAWHNGRSSWHCSQIVRDVAPALKLSARGKNTGLKEELKYIPSNKMENNFISLLILSKSPLSSLSSYKISSSTYVTKLIIRVK
ncbi:Rab3 Gtpase-Activating Protein Non-Catalytic Subunit [Manis pentadactyla]|nr:Rab3 Gtpase-Activating Protein Non-Catalytic Subunit [Manis pentadactyla]